MNGESELTDEAELAYLAGYIAGGLSDRLHRDYGMDRVANLSDNDPVAGWFVFTSPLGRPRRRRYRVTLTRVD